MANTVVALDGITVVVRGHFNAAIFSPLWLLQQNLIGPSDFADAKIEVITSEFASFSTGWLDCQIVPDTLQLATADPADFERVRDVAMGILNTLPHTPIAAVGINRALHFQARTPDQYHAIGDRLAPKDFWEPLVEFPGTRDVTIWGSRPDSHGGRIQIQVEPSFRFAGHIFVSHNEHFNLRTVEHRATSRDEAWSMESTNAPSEPSAANIPIASEILSTVWASCIKRSDDVVEALVRIQ
ncbi:hypothetical protein C6A86_002335 [Mycobacterium sp. ITM-2016-00316]|uniref:hypothetical protein n=1 Tax=Mycobacterium sp. ITM-2016-00316 TaxID=2099695 RepID=UPI0011594CD0|nr:hypothetical protein [Mycobacterium sp. ITM-2016-00316]WNG82562.1 hypothetical protein C6A86_002335 [Mycobacterium sp. ITM-2016-00316]